MDVAERIARYEAIEKHRGRPLIVYATTTRPNVGGQMAADAVRGFIDQLDSIPTDVNHIDVLIHSTGGDALTAWKLMAVLRERFERVSVLVPFMAFSAATIFALGADEIVLHPHASLGPIDPQVLITLPDGKQRRFSFEDVGAFLRFVLEEVGLSEQAHLTPIAENLFKVVDPLHVGAAKRASELSTDVGERLLQMHAASPEEKSAARRIAEGLNKSFFAHGDAVSRSRARDLQLSIAPDDRTLEALIWNAFLALEEHMELRKPFNALQHFLADPTGAAALAPKGAVVLPANAPPTVVQQVWQQVANSALAGLAAPAVQVSYSLINAVLESPRLAFEYRTEGLLTAARVGGGEIQISATDTKTGWQEVEKSDPDASSPAAVKAT